MKKPSMLFYALVLPILLFLGVWFTAPQPVRAQEELTETPTLTSTQTPSQTPGPSLTPTLTETPVNYDTATPHSNGPSFGIESFDTPTITPTSVPTSTDWTTPINVSSSSTLTSTNPRVAAGPDGQVHIVWSELASGGKEEIYYTYWDGISWSTPINVSNSSGFASTNPQVIADSSNRAYIVWEEEDDDYSFDMEIYYSRCTGTTCTTPTSLSGPPNNWDCGVYPYDNGDWHSEGPTIAIDNDDRLMVVWSAFEPGEVTLPYSTWLASATPPATRTGCVPVAVSVPQDHGGQHAHLTGSGSGLFNVVYVDPRLDHSVDLTIASYLSGGWTTSVVDEGVSPDAFGFGSIFDIDWCDAENVLHYRSNLDFFVENIPNVNCTWNSLNDVSTTASIARDASGFPRVVWPESGHIYESQRPETGWSAVVSVSQSVEASSSPDMVADANGSLYLVWTGQVGGNSEIFFASDVGCAGNDAYEPDDLPEQSSTLTQGSSPRHALCTNDRDWFNLGAISEINHLVETFDLDPDSVNPNGDTVIELFDQFLNKIGINMDRGVGPTPGSGTTVKSSRIVWNPAAPGGFNIRVSPQSPVDESQDSGYSIHWLGPSDDVAPVDQASWGPSKVYAPTIRRSGNVLYFTQIFSFDQAQLNALNALNTTFAIEFRRPEVDPSSGLERKFSSVDYGDYYQSVNGGCVGVYKTNLPKYAVTDKWSEESNEIPNCTKEIGSNEEFELYLSDTSQLVAGMPYFVMIEFHIHNEYLTDQYQFYISKAEHCNKAVGDACNVIVWPQPQKGTANLIEGYLQPAP